MNCYLLLAALLCLSISVPAAAQVQMSDAPTGPQVLELPAPGAESAYTREHGPEAADDATALPERTTGPTLLSLAVEQLADAAEPVRAGAGERIRPPISSI